MQTRRTFTGLTIATLAGLAVTSLEPGGRAYGQSVKPLNVVTTTGMIADIVRKVGGERVSVRQLMGAGVDPHLYKATRADIAAMLGADIVFYNGLLLEGKLSDALVRIATSGKPVFAVTELLDESALIHPAGADGHFDPHVWMDPLAWSKAVEVVRDKLASRDPVSADLYGANAAKAQGEIAALNAYAEKILASAPKERRVLVTAHDAFNYFGRRYGFEVLGIQGISTESEAGLKQVEALVDVLVSRRIPAVFVESTIPERSVRALIAGARAKGHNVAIGGELFSDAMGKPGTYEGTYIGMIDHNVTTIARALGADAPARGLNGKLALTD